LRTGAVNRRPAPLPAAEGQARQARTGSKGNCHFGTARERPHHEDLNRHRAANSESLFFRPRGSRSRRLHSLLSYARQKARADAARASIIGQGKQTEPANTSPPAASLLKSCASRLAANRASDRPLAMDAPWYDDLSSIASKLRILPTKSQAIFGDANRVHSPGFDCALTVMIE